MAILSINIINYCISSYFFSFKNNIHIKKPFVFLIWTNKARMNITKKIHNYIQFKVEIHIIL